MGNHRDAVLSDVTIIIRPEFQDKFDDVVKQLTTAGVAINNANPDACAVEGTIDQTKVHALQTLAFVDAVRTVFSYVADYPVGDPRDLDGPEKDDD